MGTIVAKQRTVPPQGLVNRSGNPMDRRRIELQIRSVVVTYRIEQRRRDSPTMEAFRARAHELLDTLDDAVRLYPDLQARIEEARQELDRS